jgi:hypothetical protein
MPDHHILAVAGKITHVFGHRFVVQTSRDAILCDVTPKGLERITLEVGDRVELEGEKKPSELKVTRFTASGSTLLVEHKPKHHDHHGAADPEAALKAAKTAGFAIHGEPRRKPKHFEVLGERDARFSELHIELDGRIRKTKPVDRHDPKWVDTIKA